MGTAPNARVLAKSSSILNLHPVLGPRGPTFLCHNLLMLILNYNRREFFFFDLIYLTSSYFWYYSTNTKRKPWRLGCTHRSQFSGSSATSEFGVFVVRSDEVKICAARWGSPYIFSLQSGPTGDYNRIASSLWNVFRVGEKSISHWPIMEESISGISIYLLCTGGASFQIILPIYISLNQAKIRNCVLARSVNSFNP